MEKAELISLLTPEGLRLLDEVSATVTADPVSAVSQLRAAGHPAELVAAVLTQARLREKATTKLGEFATRMLFTDAGLEQATRLAVAAQHAGRYARAGVTSVADLGCGIGVDSLALAALDLEVTAVERDEVTAAIATFNLAPFPSATVVQADAQAVSLAGVDAVYLDPARRSSGHSNTTRLVDPDDYTPSLDVAWGLAKDRPTGVKLGPGFDRSAIPEECEAQWVSDNGSVVELGLWFGALARPGVTRSALVIGRDGQLHELTAASDSDDEPTRELGEYLYEPDGAVIRARLIGDLARTMDAGMVSDGIAYLTAAEPTATPFAVGFRVIDRLPLDERTIKRYLRDRGVGTLEVKKRGADIDPAKFRTKMALRGDAQATIMLTRVDGRHAALILERLRP